MPDDLIKKVDDSFPDIQPGPQPLNRAGADGTPVNAVSRFSEYGENGTPPVPAHEEARLRAEQLAAEQARGAALNQGVAPDDSRGGGIGAMEKRINRLYGQWKTAEEGKSALEARYNDLEQKYAALEARLGQAAPLPSRGPVPARPTQQQVGFPGFAPPPYGQVPVPPAAQGSTDSDVLSAIQSLAERLDRKDKMEALSFAQEQTWSQAVAEFPELKDPNHPLAQAARQVFQRDPNFRLDPTGPYRAVIMARGLLADSIGTQATLETARRAAATPQATAVGVEGSTTAQLRTQYQALLDRMARGIGNTHENWKESARLRRQILSRGGQL